MANPSGSFPRFRTLITEEVELRPAATQGTGNTIAPGVRSVRLGANTTDANDFTVLPSLASVPAGHMIVICAGSAANSELRTPASSNETINNVDSDGTAEALLTANNTYLCIKRQNAGGSGWVLTGYTNLGAVQTAIVPDA